jgi:hypothetical protein
MMIFFIWNHLIFENVFWRSYYKIIFKKLLAFQATNLSLGRHYVARRILVIGWNHDESMLLDRKHK